MKQFWRKVRSRAPVMVAAVFLTGLLALAASAPSVRAQSNGRDCDDNAVIRCGALTEDELRQRYRENQDGNVQAIFAEFGITSEEGLTGLVEGVVDTQNNVYVNGERVATNAYTAGRHIINNSRGTSTPILDGAAYRRQPSVSFADPSGSLRALVKMENGVFRHAVLTSCGNPVTAQPVERPVPPPEKPAPPPEKPAPPAPAPKVPDFEVRKDVRIHGDSTWQNSVSADRGDAVEFRITIENTGETELTNVMVRDTLPDGLDLSTDGLQVPDETEGSMFEGEGVNVGDLPAGQEMIITFRAMVESDADACNEDRMENIVRVRPDDLPAEEDEALVEVCVEVPPPPAREEKPVERPPLPVTGVGGVLVGFTAVSGLGFTLHRLVEFYKRWLAKIGY